MKFANGTTRRRRIRHNNGGGASAPPPILGGVMTITATRQWNNGSWIISAVVDGYLESISYYGYTKQEAMARFREEMKRRRYAK
jgi:hypothetical protein